MMKLGSKAWLAMCARHAQLLRKAILHQQPLTIAEQAELNSLELRSRENIDFYCPLPPRPSETAVFEFEVVLYRSDNPDDPGFHIDQEMADWLCDCRRWEIVSPSLFRDEQQHNVKLTCLALADDMTTAQFGVACYVNPNMHTVEFRSQPDLVDCVRALQAYHKGDSQNYAALHLEIVKFKIKPKIEYPGVNFETCDCRVTYHVKHRPIF